MVHGMKLPKPLRRIATKWKSACQMLLITVAESYFVRQTCRTKKKPECQMYTRENLCTAITLGWMMWRFFRNFRYEPVGKWSLKLSKIFWFRNILSDIKESYVFLIPKIRKNVPVMNCVEIVKNCLPAKQIVPFFLYGCSMHQKKKVT